MSLKYVKGTRLWLKGHPEFSEAWLRDLIAEDPSVLGLGALELRASERTQPHAGRLDLLLQNSKDAKRYVVELTLGRVDESHVVRCMEYWDTERKRFPGYDHCAVLVAEEVTARFLNILELINGVVPIVALQVSALQVNTQVVLSFTKLLDEVALGTIPRAALPADEPASVPKNDTGKPVRSVGPVEAPESAGGSPQGGSPRL